MTEKQTNKKTHLFIPYCLVLILSYKSVLLLVYKEKFQFVQMFRVKVQWFEDKFKGQCS